MATAEAAQTLSCEVAAVRAVAEVESHSSGFDAQGRPTILNASPNPRPAANCKGDARSRMIEEKNDDVAG